MARHRNGPARFTGSRSGRRSSGCWLSCNKQHTTARKSRSRSRVHGRNPRSLLPSTTAAAAATSTSIRRHAIVQPRLLPAQSNNGVSTKLRHDDVPLQLFSLRSDGGGAGDDTTRMPNVKLSILQLQPERAEFISAHQNGRWPTSQWLHSKSSATAVLPATDSAASTTLQSSSSSSRTTALPNQLLIFLSLCRKYDDRPPLRSLSGTNVASDDSG